MPTAAGSPANNPAPGETWVPIVTNDTVDLQPTPRGIWVGGGGTVVVRGTDNVLGTFLNVPAGSMLPLRATRVMTASTATNMLAVY